MFEFKNPGLIKSPEDYRDVKLSMVQEALPIPPAYATDLSLLPVWNQQKLGACVAHASGKYKQKEELDEKQQVITISPRFIYALCKSQDGIPGEGTYYRLAMQVLQQYGCCTEDYLPNDTSLDHASYIDLSKITTDAYGQALNYAIKSYAKVDPLNFDSLKQAIYQNGVVMLGVELGKEWWTGQDGVSTWDPAKLFPIRPPAEVESGHAILAFGYDQDNIYFMNSWSSQWGKGGVGWFGRDYEPYFVEAWTAVDLPDDWLSHLSTLPPDFHHDFETNLFLGCNTLSQAYRDEVKNLQIALTINGTFPREKLTPDNMGYFGPTTLKAVIDFQKKYFITPALGFVGPKTRAMLNNLFK